MSSNINYQPISREDPSLAGHHLDIVQINPVNLDIESDTPVRNELQSNVSVSKNINSCVIFLSVLGMIIVFIGIFSDLIRDKKKIYNEIELNGEYFINQNSLTPPTIYSAYCYTYIIESQNLFDLSFSNIDKDIVTDYAVSNCIDGRILYGSCNNGICTYDPEIRFYHPYHYSEIMVIIGSVTLSSSIIIVFILRVLNCYK